MRNHHSFFFRQALVLPVFVLTLFAGSALNAAVSFTVTPSSADAGSLAPVTLQITGVTSGSTVQIQKYIDYNGNGVADANELVIQSFQVTDNHSVIFGGVTNTAVPGDRNPASGAITVVLNAANNGVTPYFSGKFLYKLSSPTSAFTAITKPFMVNNTTNSGAGSITGKVTYNGASVSNAAIIVLTPPSGGNGYTSVGGGVANSSGNFTVKVPAGQYVVGAFLSNYVANVSSAKVVSVVAGQSVTNNLTVTHANQTISGKIYDTNSGTGFPAFGVFCQSTNGYAALGFTSSTGTFSVPVNNGYWKVSNNERELGTRGYLSTQHSVKVNAIGSGVSGINIAVPKANAMIYGRIVDNNGNPVAGVDMFSSDGQDYEAEALTDANGYYYVGASSSNYWNVSLGIPQAPTVEYDYSGSYNSTNLASGSALEEDFGAIAAPYTISGDVDDGTNGAIVGVDVSASAVINGINYQSVASETDTNGHYSINVANGATWAVQVAEYTGDNGGLYGLGYNPSVDPENVIINNQNGQANFLVPPLGYQELDGYVMDSNGNPIVGVNVDAVASGYTNLIAVTDNNGYYEFYVGDGSWNVSVDCDILNQHGYTNCPAEQDGIPVGFGGNASGIDFVVQVPQISQYGPFFDGQAALGAGWYWLEPANETNEFGIYLMTEYPYVFHEDMGYEYYIDAGNASHGAYFYDFTDGAFFYTDPALFPYLYDFAVNSWVYYAPATGSTYRYTSNPRWFLNFTTTNWVTNLTFTSQPAQ